MKNKIKLLGAVVTAFAIASTMFTIKYERTQAYDCSYGLHEWVYGLIK